MEYRTEEAKAIEQAGSGIKSELSRHNLYEERMLLSLERIADQQFKNNMLFSNNSIIFFVAFMEENKRQNKANHRFTLLMTVFSFLIGLGGQYLIRLLEKTLE